MVETRTHLLARRGEWWWPMTVDAMIARLVDWPPLYDQWPLDPDTLILIRLARALQRDLEADRVEMEAEDERQRRKDME